LATPSGANRRQPRNRLPVTKKPRRRRGYPS
jgi:hypothetical protein